MAFSSGSVVVNVKCEVKSTNSSVSKDLRHGTRKGGYEHSSKSKDSDRDVHTRGHGFRGGPHRGRGSHQGHHAAGRGHDGGSKSDHAAVEVCVALDQATISNSHKPYERKDKHQEQSQYKERRFSGHGRGTSRAESHGQYEKPYKGHQTDHDSSKHKSKNPTETFKSYSQFCFL